MATALPYTFIADLAREVEIPTDGTLSRTLYQDENVKVVVFAFSAGQELSEHTAARPAVLHVLEGQIALTLGSDHHEAAAGAWVHMPPNLPHSLRAETPAVVLLLLL